MPLKRHTYSYPTRLEYGLGLFDQVAQFVAESDFERGLLVTDKGLSKQGLPERLVLQFKSKGMALAVFDSVSPNPTEKNVLKGLEVFKEEKSQFIVVLGGGSPIDAGKAIQLLSTHSKPLRPYSDELGGCKRIQNNMPPLYAVPTTAGTGSEVGRSAAITIDEKKVVIFSPFLMPKIAVLDPELTVSLPKKLTAATGIDALVHNLEAFLVEDYHPIADAIAKEGIYKIIKNLPLAFADGDNLEARGEMMLAASMGAMAFQKGLGLNHSIAHALGALFNIHHGLANAVVLAEVMKFNLGSEQTAQKLATLGCYFYPQIEKYTGKAVVDAIGTFLKKLKFPHSLSEIGISPEDLPKIEAVALADPLTQLNPRKVAQGDIISILKPLIS